MNEALVQFRENLRHVRNLRGIYLAILGSGVPGVDLSDLLRSQIVMAVSALDTYFHSIARLGMLEVFNGQRPPTNAYSRFTVSLDCAANLMQGGGAALDLEVRRIHGFVSFQDPNKIADAVRLFSDVELWPRVAAAMGETVEHAKLSVSLIVQRRNKIAHEADLDPVYGTRWPIDEPLVDGAIDRIERVCETIHTLI